MNVGAKFLTVSEAVVPDQICIFCLAASFMVFIGDIALGLAQYQLSREIHNI